MALLVPPEQPALRELQEQLVPKARRVLLARLDQPAPLVQALAVPLVLPDQLDQPERMALSVLRVQPELQVRQALRVPQVQPGLRVRQVLLAQLEQALPVPPAQPDQLALLVRTERMV